MIPPAQDSTIASDWNTIIGGARQFMARLTVEPGLGLNALGVPDWDRNLWRLGRSWIEAHMGEIANAATLQPEQRTNVFLATQIAEDGGHTPLIGDFVRALDRGGGPGELAGASSHLIVTNLDGENSSPLVESIRSRTGIPAANITVLEHGSLLERMEQLFVQLLALRPRRLFLFLHPDDPLASIVAQPEIAPQRVLVHFSDAMPTFGMHVPGVRIIDLNPFASAMSRLIGLDPALLLLTAPDPGPRPCGFLQRGKLVTATSGRPQKFSIPYFFSYPEAVGVILESTGGWHVHIGRLDETQLLRIHDVLLCAKVPPGRFIHIPWTESVATTLWEHQCDVYFSSFPMDGARTNAEVLASATPHLRHSTRSESGLTHSAFGIEGGEVWQNLEDLKRILREMSAVEVLKEKSHLMRLNYERLHHPRIFSEKLYEILAGGKGWNDPQAHERDQRAANKMLKSLVSLLTSRMNEVKKQEKRIDFLQEQRKRQDKKIARLESDRDQWLKGRSMRAKIMRWLMRP